MDQKVIAGVAVVILVAAIAGYFLISGPTGGPGEEAAGEETYIVIGYYWGFKIYDSNYNPVDKIMVKKGTTLKIIFLNARSFAEDFYGPLEEESKQKGVGGLDNGPLEQKIMEALENNQVDHGLQIIGYGVTVATNYKAFSGTAKNLQEFFQNEPQDAINQHTVVFKADKTGVFDFVCYVVCGYGHSFMVLKGALQVYE